MLYEPNKYSFELNSEMLKLVHDEFDVEKITSRPAKAGRLLGRSCDATMPE